MKKLLLFSMIMTAAAALPAAADPDFGFRGGARALATGEAGAAAQSGWESLYWNPAGLANTSRVELGVGHTSWAGINSETLGAAIPVGPAALGIGGAYRGLTDLRQRDAAGNDTGSLDNSGGSVQLAVAERIQTLSLGVGLSHWEQSLAGASNNGTYGNVGATLNLDVATLGVSAYQLGTGLDPIVQGSLGFGVGDTGLWLGGGYISEQADSRWGVGAEFAVVPEFAVRAGYEMPTNNSTGVEGLTGLTAGLGLGVGALKVDYAFMPVGDLGQVHRIQLGFKFGEPTSDTGSRSAARDY